MPPGRGWRINVEWIEHQSQWIFPDTAMPRQMSFHIMPLDAQRSCLLVVADTEDRLRESALAIAREVVSALKSRLPHDARAEQDCEAVLRAERRQHAETPR